MLAGENEGKESEMLAGENEGKESVMRNASWRKRRKRECYEKC